MESIELGAGYIDAIWLSLAFLSGLLMKRLGLPALLGFLATGFFLGITGYTDGNLKQILVPLSDLGIILLLFTIGLKIKIKELVKPEILITASSHIILTTLAIGGVIFGLGFLGIQYFTDMTLEAAMIIGFALSFSSTVFIVKSLEERGEITSRHGRFAIGILVVQDIFAVVFLTLSKSVMPSIWALALPVYLYLIKLVLDKLLNKTGHGELLTVFGFFAPLIAGALAFDLVDLKYDLGALIIGMLLVNHPRKEELYDRMLSYKDFFLIGFFINIGLSGVPSLTNVAIAGSLMVFVIFKGLLFIKLFSFFELRARTNFLTSLQLSNYSEFGLIVGAVAVSNGMIDSDWLTTLAIFMSFSFLLSSPVVARSYELFEKYQTTLTKWNRTSKGIDKQAQISGEAKYVIIGLGSIGMPAYQHLKENFPDHIIGVDYNADKVKQLKEEGNNVVWGDSTDRDFWDESNWDRVDVVVLAMSDYASNHNTMKQINKMKERQFKIAAICHYEDEKEIFEKLNVDYIYDYKTSVGEDFAQHAMEKSRKIVL
ncbi:cation:proton antiporter family protein [Brumimicrobium oceani]|uniref:Potassium transporter Kef n=1 Tax=Brumimicrobium oceani TaxID=2100725 RepID=A0A2U2XAG2_9FLAO|nr:cation:proton antiporter family protein [Brumimicrobium oceani]PWH84784.1 potassium transporter Kef [Brumimicrobium oceani]